MKKFPLKSLALFFLLTNGLCPCLSRAQTFFIEPALQLKTHWSQKKSDWNTSSSFAFQGVNYQPMKFATKNYGSFDFGASVGYKFENGILFSAGIFRETPQLAFTLSYVSHDIISPSSFVENLPVTCYYFFTKIPLNLSFKFGTSSIFQGKIKLQHYLGIGYSHIRVASTRPMNDIAISGIRPQENTSLFVSIQTKRVLGNFPFLSFNYSAEVLIKKKELFTVKAFVELGFKTLAVYTVQMDVSNSSGPVESAIVIDRTRGSGFGFQLTRKFKFLSREIKESDLRRLE